MKDKKQIKGFIFDMDGTIFATERLYGMFWKQVGEEMGYLITDEMLDEMRGASLQHGAEVFEAANPGFDYYKVRERRLEKVFAYIDENGVPKMKGLDELFAYLHAHAYKIALGTSTIGPQARRYLQSVGMIEDFDFIGTGELVEHGKPAPDLFCLCAEQMGLKPEECCVVEDSVNGLKAGIAAGGFVIGIEDMQDISPVADQLDVQLNSLDEIIGWLES